MKNFQNQTKIIKVSKVICAILFIGVILWGVAAVAVTINVPWKDLPERANFMCFRTISGLVFSVMNIVAFCYLFNFFKRLKNGHLFDAPTVRNLEVAGKWLIARWLLGLLLFPIAYEYFGKAAFLPNFEGLLAGLSLVCGAWLLKEAQGLQEEQELTV